MHLAQAENMTDKRSRDWSEERKRGACVPRADLDNRPVITGYLGPMYDGERYMVDGVLRSNWELSDMDKLGREPVVILRYETQEVYDMMSN